MGFAWEGSFWVFLFLTVILGGGAAWKTGEAVARSWGTPWQLVFFVLLLGCAIRFLHYGLFNGTLLSAHYFAADGVVLGLLAWLGHRNARAEQMTARYPWRFEPSGFMSWRIRDDDVAGRR